MPWSRPKPNGSIGRKMLRMNNLRPITQILYRLYVSAGYPRPIEMSDSASKPRAWEARVGLGGDGRTRLWSVEGAEASRKLLGPDY